MGFSGRLEGIAPSDIFQIISQNRMTGTLIARFAEGTAMVVFKDGQVMEATSDAPGESLGHILVAQGLIREKMLEAAQDRLKQEPDRMLGAVLVEMGAINEKTLEAVVYRHIGHIVHRLISTEDGFLTFDRGEGAVKRKLNTREFLLPSGVSAEYLIMERARVVDEERRHRPDRRAHPSTPDLDGVPAGGERRASMATGSTGTAAVMTAFTSRLQAVKLPAMERLRETARSVMGKGRKLAGTVIQNGNELAATAVRRGKQVVATAGDLLRGTVMPWLRSARSRVRGFSPDGKALIFAGIGGIAAGTALILLTTFSAPPPVSELVITGRVVNVRASAATKAKVVAKVARGSSVSLLSSAGGWHQVRTQAGATGWIAEKLAEKKEIKAEVSGLGMTIAVIVLAAGLAFLIIGLLRYRRAASDAPRILREVK